MKIIRVGVDLAKNVFHVHGVDRKEEAVWRRKLSREKWLKVVMEKLEPGAEVGMEACAGSYHWARQLEAGGFRVKLMAPQFVKPTLGSLMKCLSRFAANCTICGVPLIRTVIRSTFCSRNAAISVRLSGSFESDHAAARWQ